jgi:hypothetical protein
MAATERRVNICLHSLSYTYFELSIFSSKSAWQVTTTSLDATCCAPAALTTKVGQRRYLQRGGVHANCHCDLLILTERLQYTHRH